jgi:arylsulfatase A-like enzyme
VTLLPEYLRQQGYHTMAAVSLDDLWPEQEGTGLDRGFQQFDRGTEPVERAGSVMRRVKTMLDRMDPSESFFLLAHFADPHEPYNAYDGESREAHIMLDDRPVAWVKTSELNRWEQRARLSPGQHLLEFSSDAGIRLRNFSYEFAGRAMPFDVRVGDFLGSSERIVIVLNNPSDAEIEVNLRAWLNDTPPLMELRERYQREIEAVDRAVGELVAQLKHRGLYEDTIIVLTSGYGEALGDHGHVGHDVNLYDELLHVPLYVRLPEHWTEQRAMLLENSLGTARHVDVAPTLLELLDLPPWDGLQGRSLLHEARRVVQAEVLPPASPNALYAMRDAQYKLIYDPTGAGSFTMYRLGPDPGELENVFAHQGHLRNEWQGLLRGRATAAPGPR